MENTYTRIKVAKEILQIAKIELIAKVAELNDDELIESMKGDQRLRLHNTTKEKLESWIEARTEFEEAIQELLSKDTDATDA